MEKFDKISYNNLYNQKKYDRINLLVPKGQKQTIASRAAENGESVNAFVNRLIRQALDGGVK